jgi:hypothetical protein
VYIFVGWLFHQLLREEVAALLVAGCLFSSLAILLLYRLSSRLFAPRVATGACLLFIANPLLFLEAEKLFSDAFALLFLVAAIDFTEEAARAGGAASGFRRAAVRAGYLAGVSAGLMLGVRLSLWPFVLSMALWLWLRRFENPQLPLRALVHGGIHGVGVWLIPLLALTDLRSMAAAGADHVRGHFTQWGETAVTHQDLFTRLVAFCWDLGPNGLGLWWPDAGGFRLLATFLVVVALSQYVRVHRLGYATRLLLVFALPYAVWVFLGQNLANPRHVLPLVALLLPALAAGLLASHSGRAPLGAALCGLLVAVWTITALSLVELNRRSPPTRVALVSYVRDRYSPEQTAVVCWNSARFFGYMAPGWVERVAPSVEEGTRLAGRDGVVLVLSDMPGFEELQRRFALRPVRRFSRSRYVHNYLHQVALYELAR